MNFSLQFCKVQKAQYKRTPVIQNAIHRYIAVVRFHNRLCKRQAKANALRIL